MSSDRNIPFTEEELLQIEEAFKSVKSYKDGSMAVEDLGPFLHLIPWHNQSEEAINGYSGYWRRVFGGTIPLEEMMDIMRKAHNAGDYFEGRVRAADKDGNGLIDEKEFAELLKVFQVCKAKAFEGITWGKFVEQADINEDGKIQLEEAVDWVKKNINE